MESDEIMHEAGLSQPHLSSPDLIPVKETNRSMKKHDRYTPLKISHFDVDMMSIENASAFKDVSSSNIKLKSADKLFDESKDVLSPCKEDRGEEDVHMDS